MASFYGPTAPNGPNDGDLWTNSSTGLARIWQSGAWQATSASIPADLAPTTLALPATASIPATSGAGRISRLTGQMGGLLVDTGSVVAHAFGRLIDVRVKGAKADYVKRTDGTTTATSTTFTSAGASFAATDVGKVIVIAGAGAAGAKHVTTIAARTNATQITLTDAAGTSVAGTATFFYGTDDTAAFQAALDAASQGTVFVPAGSYLISTITVAANRRLIGAGFAATYLIPYTDADCIQVNTTDLNSANKVFNIHLEGFAVYPLLDMTAGAGLHLGNVGSLMVRNVKISSGLGGKPFEGVRIDMVSDSSFEQVWVSGAVQDGVIYDPPVDGGGYVGRTVETFWGDGCKVNACGRYGVYLRMAQTYGTGTGTGSGTLEGVHLLGVSVYGNVSGACRVETTTAAATIRNIHLEGTVLDTSTAGPGLYLGGAAGTIENVLVQNCWSSANAGAGAYGIYVGSVVDECLVHGGSVQYNELDGIRVDGAERTKIAGDVKVWNNSQATTATSYGVYVTGAATGTAVDAIVYNTGKAAKLQNGLLIDASTVDTDYAGYYDTGAGTTRISVHASATRARSGLVVDDATQAYQAIKTQTRVAGLIVDTSTSGTAATLRLTDSVGTSHKYFRMSGTVLQIANSALNAIVATLNDVGGWTCAAITATQATLGAAVLTLQSTATNDDPNYLVYQNRVATTDATVTTLHTVAIAASTTYLIDARVVARRTGGASGTADDGAVYVRRALVTTKSGTVTINAVDGDLTQEDQAAWDCTLTVSSTNVLVRVTGAASNNVTWHGTVIVQSVGT